ncbi:trypsin-like peptidase domain-containing protein [Actinokineospora sp. NBRC 105648]|uniref:S1C family serine protease n=1 Tax=Actinokineospora sp. NBRC 105648 TaxID=3032206 RepID=UPI002554B2F9|nr:trypsin-like peptidase domain-containing protein [Actinokineospora sp. NBRC 105648]
MQQSGAFPQPGSQAAAQQPGGVHQSGDPDQGTHTFPGAQPGEQGSATWSGSPWQAPGSVSPDTGSWQRAGEHQQVLYGTAVNQPAYAAPVNYPAQQVPVQRREGRKSGLVVGMTVLALVVGGAAGAAGGYLAADNRSSSSSATALDAPPTAKQTAAAPAGSVESVAQKVLPSVVQLQVQGRSSAGEGSGFVISADGLIVTNNHVVEGAANGGQITAVFQDGRTAKASIVGRDPTSDVAVVRATGVDNLVVSELGRSDDLRVGQGVVAIGSPYELSGTVTSGIVSSLRRPTRAGGETGSQTTVMDAIQTDAAINPGNSGGPLVNMQGQVIGINSAIYSPQTSASGSGGSVGIGFAIPIDQARRTADEIVKTGKATQTVLGVSVRDADGGGALIADVVAGGAGEKAGLKPGDVVTKMDDRRIDSSDALVAAVRSRAPGDKVKLTIGAGDRTIEATLGGQPVEPQ